MLIEALRRSLRAGVRPAGLVAFLDAYPKALGTSDDPYVRAAQVAELITTAVREMGDGPYGRAAQALFGMTVGTRGRLLKDRRRAAAGELDIMVGTWRRYYEADVLADIATALWTRIGVE